MNTGALKRFAQAARRQLREQVATKLEKVLSTDSAELREKGKALEDLKKLIADTSKSAVIDQVAYIWFNRFCALRFMDANGYTRIGAVSPAVGNTQPEILLEAKQGVIEESLEANLDRQKVFDLLSGKLPSSDPQQEAYRLLLVAVCNSYHGSMPFLFERIAHFTELLMPDDLLSEASILTSVRETLTIDACQDVEVIGWLYQFYISEKKDEVFDGLKKNKKITPENIPAATQLFTPHWIVRYLVENSLGRLWLLNRPSSKLIERMDYYIKPEQAEADFLRIGKPEEIKVCDPACGSGHMLTYAFDLLYAIYEEEGYESAEIPTKILTHNLYGIEIDERAGELAAFALTMKARAKQRRFFRKPVQPNICVLRKIEFAEGELKEYMDFIGRDLFTSPLQTTLRQFEEADNFGSLIRPDITAVEGMLKILESKDVSGHLFISMTHQKMLQALRQTEYLCPQYHVVVANPPYMGGKGMNGRLSAWAKNNYPNSKSDLFAMFIERNLDLAKKQGSVAMITMQSWMFLSSFEGLRARLLSQDTLLSMAHLGARAFDSIGGEVVSTTAFVLENANRLEYKGRYLRLVDGDSEAEKEESIRNAIKNPDCGLLYLASAADFKKIPGSPIAYWVSKKIASIFSSAQSFDGIGKTRRGLQTGDAGRFIRCWHEVSLERIGRNLEKIEAGSSGFKWFFFNSGGTFRKWYGNIGDVVNWGNDGDEIKATGKAIIPSEHLYFKEAVTWPKVSSGRCSFRWFPDGIIPGDAGPCFYDESGLQDTVLCFSNSKVALSFLQFLSPTLNFEVGVMAKMPILQPDSKATKHASGEAIKVHQIDWNAYENSCDFTSLPLLQCDYRQTTLKATYLKLRAQWKEMTLEMERLEEDNNRIFIEAYGLQAELTPEVPLNEITLTCNPHYRYGNGKNEKELEALLLADTMRELISYAVGCMFGRYTLEKPGLILANQGETIEDYLKRVPEASFPADDDNVIPMLDGDWFTDDISDRFRTFLRITFGVEHYEDNLKFVEKALGKDVRKYFLKDFYNDHIKRYKKRPIYWLFSSTKGSFNALIYMHRYRPDTVSVVLNDYLREFRTKLESRLEHLQGVSISVSATQGEKTLALKDIEKLKKIIDELEDYEREVLYPLATRQIEIDLDDGVKVNYPKFDDALKKVTGLSRYLRDKIT
ncbi:BREX-1 system adenine-specific DNA-methyltransferase PglX [uncultured Desulfuromonas sp.]|uniref:BREX-1 system adenine-specific DNA-methyltransferase PglX n=1 Tax=uncultured Desulfuromonas sp. TaxID=181013 RepID=UPI002623365E|nr:BREX-1 system adenine-specific DNA-methyltransferase PglX [uncultured Desulfuromonas sp.]